MKRQIFFIHGAESFSKYDDFLHYLKTAPLDPFKEPSKRWTHTLREDLGEAFEVFMPQMPNKQNAKYEEWKLWFERHFSFLHDGVILVGWSQGGYFFVKYLIENNVPFAIRALYLIAAPYANISSDNGEDGGDFQFDTTRVGELAKKVGKIKLFHSTDDPVVPYRHAEFYKEALSDAELVTFEDRSHFLQEEFLGLLGHLRSEVGK